MDFNAAIEAQPVGEGVGWNISSEDQTKARDILDLFGQSSMDYFKILPDKTLFFEDSLSFASYRMAENVAIALGDPVGPQDKVEQTVFAFFKFCQKKHFILAFHHVLPNYISIYKKLGFNDVKIGEDATVDLSKFCNSTIHNQHFRHIRSKFENEGFSCRLYTPPHTDSLLDKVEEVSKEWLTLPGRRERSFTLGYFNREYLNTTPLYCLEGPHGNIYAFMNIIPSYKRGEATIDLMRHRIDVPNGCMDDMFLHLFENRYKEGYKTFYLGLAPLAGVGEEPGSSHKERALHFLYDHLHMIFSYKGMRFYKEKFEPEWEDRYFVYQEGPLHLTRMMFAFTKITEMSPS